MKKSANEPAAETKTAGHQGCDQYGAALRSGLIAESLEKWPIKIIRSGIELVVRENNKAMWGTRWGETISCRRTYIDVHERLITLPSTAPTFCSRAET